jgi:hypothetical protein
MVAVFREVKRVLREDGVLFLEHWGQLREQAVTADMIPAEPVGIGRRDKLALKPKDLCGIPWRVAFALQEDGWWLRSEITWCKKAPMPESVTDRPTSATEKIFLLTKSAKYFYDAEAVKEASVDPEGTAARYALPFNVGEKGIERRRQTKRRTQHGRHEGMGRHTQPAQLLAARAGAIR